MLLKDKIILLFGLILTVIVITLLLNIDAIILLKGHSGWARPQMLAVVKNSANMLFEGKIESFSINTLRLYNHHPSLFFFM